MAPEPRTTATRLSWVAALAVAVAVATGGCGAGTSQLLHPGSGHTSTNASPGVPAATLRVIKGWSQALRAGHVAAAARFFQLPSVFYLGSGPPVQLRTLAQAEVVNAALPCGAQFISALPAGRYINVLFRLTNRAGRGGTGGCGSGTGDTARTDFVIRNGRILEWLRAPDQPGDNGSPQTTPSQPTPTTPTPPGTTPGGGSPLV